MVQPLRSARTYLFLLFFLLAGVAGSDLYAQSVRFAVETDTVSEGQNRLVAELILDHSGPLQEDLELDFALQTNLSTVTEADFSEPTSQTFTFPAGSEPGAVHPITLILADDADFEESEHATFIVRSADTRTIAPAVFRLVVADDDQPGVIISELMPYPAGDANGDGRPGEEDDRFVELWNRESTAVDLSGWVLEGRNGPIHRFGEGEFLPPGGALVIFGGDRWSGHFGGSRIIGAADLPLNGEEDLILLNNRQGVSVDQFAYNRSLPRTASLVRFEEEVRPHAGEGSGETHYSPGVREDGSYYSRSKVLQGGSGWRMLSIPSAGLSAAKLDDLFGTGVTEEAVPADIFYTADGAELQPAGEQNGPVPAGTGLLAWFAGEETGETRLPLTLDADDTSPPTGGDVTVALHSGESRWNLVGNPWHVPIDISELDQWTRGGSLASGVAQVWDPRLNSFVPATLLDNRIEAWQGFLLQNGDAAMVDIPQTAQIELSGERDDPDPERRIAFTLTGTSAVSGKPLADRAAVVTFTEEAGHQWDSGDGEKLTPISDDWVLLGLAGNREGEELLKAVDSRPLEIGSELQIDLLAEGRNREGSAELQWDLSGLPSHWDLMLRDRTTGSVTNLRTATSHPFEFREESGISRTDNRQSPPQVRSRERTGDQPPRFSLVITDTRMISDSAELPESVKLNPNYPNPFSESTTISFELSEDTHVNLSIWNMLAQKVATLVDGTVEAGEQERVWEAGNLPSGIYFIILEVNGVVYNRKMALIK